jgi:hypothetical protein
LDALRRSDSVLSHIDVPDANDSPSQPAKFGVYSLVSRLVAQDLQLPELGEPARRELCRMAVPERAVYKNRDARAAED